MRALAAALLVAVGAAITMCNDLLIRARGLNGEGGIDAFANDLIGSLLVYVGLAAFVIEMWRGRPNAHLPQAPRPPAKPFLPPGTREHLENGTKFSDQ